MAGGMIIAKAILGGIGGGFEGAGNGATSGKAKSFDNLGKAGKKLHDFLNKEKETTEEKTSEEETTEEKTSEEDVPSDGNLKNGEIASNDFSAGFKAYNKGSGSGAAAVGSILSKIKSDEGLKTIYGESLTDELVEAFAKIDTADFTYKPEAQELYKDNPSMDSKEHIGVIAQQLAENPLTEATVEEDENGFLELNTGHLTAENTAVIAELSRRVLALEEIVKELRGNN